MMGKLEIIHTLVEGFSIFFCRVSWNYFHVLLLHPDSDHVAVGTIMALLEKIFYLASFFKTTTQVMKWLARSFSSIPNNEMMRIGMTLAIQRTRESFFLNEPRRPSTTTSDAEQHEVRRVGDDGE